MRSCDMVVLDIPQIYHNVYQHTSVYIKRHPLDLADLVLEEGGLEGAKSMVEAAGVELNKRFCFCNLQILQDRKNLKIDDSQGHRTVIVQSHPTNSSEMDSRKCLLTRTSTL